jgi:predicted Zn-dependent peptidase
LIEQGTLANGVTLLCEPIATTETCSIGFWYPSGARDEHRDERGYAHFLEHMLFKGTARRSALDIAVQVDRVGGSINAFTDKETTCFYCTLPAAHAELALDILCDMVSAAALAEDEIAKEKVVVSNEIRAAEDSPDEQGYQLFLEGLWRSHPLAARVAGVVEDVERIERRSLAAFYLSRYHPHHLIVAAAGALDHDTLAQTLSERLTADGEASVGRSRERPTCYVVREYTRGHFQQAQVYAGTTLEPAADLETYFALVLLSTAFGESMSSRLFQHIREDQGLCYSVESFRSHYSDIWGWGIYASAMPELAPRLLAALNQELHRLADEPLTPREVDAAISHITGGMVFAKEDMETRMKRLAGQYQMFGRPIEMEQSARLLRSVTAQQVAELTERLVQPGRFNLLAYGTRNMNGMRRVPFDW